jgi:hypothetical protein
MYNLIHTCWSSNLFTSIRAIISSLLTNVSSPCRSRPRLVPTDPNYKQNQDQHSSFELAMSDAALFHSIMCSSSLYLDFASGTSESPHSIIHKMEAIHLINVQLRATSAVSDAIIGAVSFLAIVKVSPFLKRTPGRQENIRPVRTWRP